MAGRDDFGQLSHFVGGMQASSRAQKLHPPSQPSSTPSQTHHFLWALVPSVELVTLPEHSLCDFLSFFLFLPGPTLWMQRTWQCPTRAGASGPLKQPYEWGTSRQEEERGAGTVKGPPHWFRICPWLFPLGSGKQLPSLSLFLPENPSSTWTGVLVYNGCSTHGPCSSPWEGALRAPFFWAVLGLRFGAQAPLVVAHELTSYRAWAYLLHGMWDLSSSTRGQTHSPCIGRQIKSPILQLSC